MAEARCELERGQYGAALLAAERALALRPDDAEAAELRNTARARLKPVTPAPVMPSSTVAGGWISLQLGYDSNATVGHDLNQVTLPLFRGRDVTEELGPLQMHPSPFGGLAGGVAVALPLSPTDRLRFGVNSGVRLYTQAPVPTNIGYEAHAEHRGERFIGGAWFADDQRGLGQYHVLDARTMGLHAGTRAWAPYEIEVFGTETEKGWPVLDLVTRERKVGVSMAHTATPWRWTLFRGLERSMSVPSFLDREIVGLGGFASWIAGKGILSLSGLYVRSEYLVYSQLFLAQRADKFSELQVAYEYAIARNWRLTPAFTWQDNRSNLGVAAFHRQIWLVELRRQF